jgi:hypothetical protein
MFEIQESVAVQRCDHSKFKRAWQYRDVVIGISRFDILVHRKMTVGKQTTHQMALMSP